MGEKRSRIKLKIIMTGSGTNAANCSQCLPTSANYSSASRATTISGVKVAQHPEARKRFYESGGGVGSRWSSTIMILLVRASWIARVIRLNTLRRR
jgi:hypothetical protein